MGSLLPCLWDADRSDIEGVHADEHGGVVKVLRRGVQIVGAIHQNR
jgi:hypothetical protein